MIILQLTRSEKEMLDKCMDKVWIGVFAPALAILPASGSFLAKEPVMIDV